MSTNKRRRPLPRSAVDQWTLIQYCLDSATNARRLLGDDVSTRSPPAQCTKFDGGRIIGTRRIPAQRGKAAVDLRTLGHKRKNAHRGYVS